MATAPDQLNSVVTFKNENYARIKLKGCASQDYQPLDKYKERYINKKFEHNYRINNTKIKQENKKYERKNKIDITNNDV